MNATKWMKSVQKWILGLILMAPFSAFAHGNCNYVAYTRCYERGVFSAGQARVWCALFGKRSDQSMISAKNFDDCKSTLKNYGQYVPFTYHDSAAKPEDPDQAGEAFRDFNE